MFVYHTVLRLDIHALPWYCTVSISTKWSYFKGPLCNKVNRRWYFKNTELCSSIEGSGLAFMGKTVFEETVRESNWLGETVPLPCSDFSPPFLWYALFRKFPQPSESTFEINSTLLWKGEAEKENSFSMLTCL